MEDAELTGKGQRVALQQRAGSLTEEAPSDVDTVPDFAALVSFLITKSKIKRLRGGFPATRMSLSLTLLAYAFTQKFSLSGSNHKIGSQVPD